MKSLAIILFGAVVAGCLLTGSDALPWDVDLPEQASDVAKPGLIGEKEVAVQELAAAFAKNLVSLARFVQNHAPTCHYFEIFKMYNCGDSIHISNTQYQAMTPICQSTYNDIRRKCSGLFYG
eukprot:scpid76572/ scgid32951/ 